jgi:hypothetical protein
MLKYEGRPIVPALTAFLIEQPQGSQPLWMPNLSGTYDTINSTVVARINIGKYIVSVMKING